MSWRPARPSSLQGVLVGAATIVAWVLGSRLHPGLGLVAALAVVIAGIFLAER